MILQSTKLSPRQNAAIEAKAGGRLKDQENVVLSRGMARLATVQERENAAQQMRYQLYLLDRSQRRPSIEDCAAALLEKAEMA
jgi:hypothetical protein